MNPKLYPSLHIVGSRQMGGAEQTCIHLVRALREEGQPVSVVLRPQSPMAPVLEETGVEPIKVPLANIWDIWSLWRIRGIVAEKKPAIVQTYMGRATRLTRLPPDTGSIHLARLDGFYRIKGNFDHAHAWVGVTKGLCDYLVSEGLPAERIFQIGHFVPPALTLTPAERLERRLQHGIPDDAWLLFALGRFVEKKGFQDLLPAFAQLPETLSGKRLHLMIAGDGPHRAALEAQAEQLGLTSRLCWLGWQDTPDHFFEMADLFICPSRHEPFGVVQLEAWNHRLPMVTTATGGALEIVTDQEDALVCPVADIPRMAQTIRTALEAPEAERQRLGEQGYAVLQARFSRDAIVRDYLDLYGKLTAA